MDELLTIGEFAARCGLSRSALRFYDQTALLCPQEVDPDTGYRRYCSGQLQTALLIRRLRAAEVPVGLVREYLVADGPRRGELLDAHARAFRARARSVQAAVRELRMADDSGGRWCALAPAALATALAQVAFAVGRPQDRPELGVVWVETREQSLRLVATDSYRMAVRDLVPAALGTGAVRGAIDGVRVSELSRRLSDATEVRLCQSAAGELSVSLDGRAEVIGGAGEDFPDYARILEGLPHGGRLVVARDAFLDALRALEPGATPVRLRFGPDGLALLAGDASDTSAARVGGDWTAAPLEVRLERTFVAQALTATVGPDVVVEAVEPRRPVTLRSADTGTFSVLTMPIAPPPAA